MVDNSRKNCLYFELPVAILFMGLLALFLLTGCSASSNDSGSKGSSANFDFSYELTEEVSFQGVTMRIDPSWAVNDSNEGTYSFSIDDDNDRFGVQTVLHGQTSNLDSAFSEFFNADGGMPNELDRWSDSGIDYISGEYNVESNSSITWILAGSEKSTGKGFVISFTAGKDRFSESEQKHIFDDLVETVEYDSDKTTMDYKDWWRESQGSSDSEKSSSSSSSSSSGFKAILTSLGTFESSTVDGSGDDVVDLPQPGTPCLMTISHNGSGNFAVHTVDSSGSNVDLLVNTIGDYSGMVTDYTDYESAHMLSIKANGSWSVTFSPLADMAEVGNGVQHSGDGVFFIEAASLTKLHLTNDGDSNFVVKGIGMSDSKLLVNEIGAYDGTVVWSQPKSFLIVNSTGNWSASW